MKTYRMNVNGEVHVFRGDGDMPVLWYLREVLGMPGTKFGCGIGQCGACTIHLDGNAIQSCLLTVSQAAGRTITTIEGLANAEVLTPVQQAWVDLDVPQCGYCQSGQIMAVADFLRQNPNPTDEDIDASITNICRCGTYTRIREAIHQAAAMMRGELRNGGQAND